MEVTVQALLFFPVVLFSLICHEIGHAYAAYRGGDDTARLQGRISLNPLAHIDPIGTLLIPALQIFGGLPLIGWAKPVPVNPLRLRSARWDLAVSLAGVSVNLVLALVAAVLLRLFILTVPESWFDVPDKSLSIPLALVIICHAFIFCNLALMLFNLIPIPPLDGSHVLLHFIRNRDSGMFRVFQFLEQFGFMILLVLVFTGMFGRLLWPVLKAMLSVIEMVLFYPKGFLIP